MNRNEIESWLERPSELSERERLICALERYSQECERLEIELCASDIESSAPEAVQA